MLAQIEEDHYVKLNEILSLCKEKLYHYDEALIRKAFFLCYRAHSEEKRASGEPFFFHPVEVAKILLTEIPLDSVSVAAALLHDVVEDTDYTYEDLQDEFGDEIASIVAGLTKISGIFDNREIKEAESFRKMLLSVIHDIRVILIKFCDRLHNMRTLDALPPHRQIRIAIETRDIYAPLAHRFGVGRIKIELENLALKYIDREAYDEIVQKLQMTRPERERYLESVMSPIRKKLNELNFEYNMSGRPKHVFSIYNKIQQRGKSFEDIYDIYGIRIILHSETNADCYNVYSRITELFSPVPDRFKDFISVPKHNGYASLHTTIVGPGGRMIEVQIRTEKMNEIAETGIAAHWRYKEKTKERDKAIDELIKWAREFIENSSMSSTVMDSDSATSFMEGFRMHLYQDEIYVFTPKGDMKTMPVNATPVDFAFEIHTEVGMRCIGAKVNGKIVSLNSKLKSGDQVEIITSKNQTPKADWEKFVVTHKAKIKIKQALNEERRTEIEKGRGIWNRVLTKTKSIIALTERDLLKAIKEHGFHFNTPADFYRGLATDKINAEEVLNNLNEKKKSPPQKELTPLTGEAQANTLKKLREPSINQKNKDAVRIEGLPGIAFEYARCCNPVPGDDIIGLLSVGSKAVKIHRRNCRSLTSDKLATMKLLDACWEKDNNGQFLAGLKILGEDVIGMTNKITEVILKSDINIRSISLDASDSLFEGNVLLYVKDVATLNRLAEKIKRIKGILSVGRLSNE
ncbi:(p)ppGpp synthetase I, SpoT/RelA [Chloroherpeton thalassium ATCC 35110]|uniref:(P)ppGpp synthetase I, SpoT/RelA n=1 Tax=Chloroherpeton thalassium (strain ATCC 35110 / GB-78) TaxID=517418 RepID=B3QV22_CHLT3|nr:bifunctional (p)ppGpp synthetase/guanosine-3',5'-bis(diphosphate) 3'-pyrophosphohydrolase [Chloroherpeton thalassium]ACF12976.1 (p)ppGpp synthetase I, SpoT/RelA [Chloroherpeton thalassium ATCC 35110]